MADEYSYVLTPDEMERLDKILRFHMSQDECDLIEYILRRGKVKWYEPMIRPNQDPSP